MPHEARSEQDGTICRPLPMATDARFQQPIKANVNDAIVGDTNTEQGADGEGENTESTDNGDNGGNGDEGQANEENAEGDQQPEASESEKTESKTKK